MGQIALIGQALALNNLGTSGLITRTGSGVVAARSLSVGNSLSAINANGISGNPWLSPIAQIQVVSSNTTIDSTNFLTYMYKMIHASNNITLTFSSTIPDGFQCSINNIGTGTITVATTPALLAKGTTISSQYDSVSITKLGGNYYGLGF